MPEPSRNSTFLKIDYVAVTRFLCDQLLPNAVDPGKPSRAFCAAPARVNYAANTHTLTDVVIPHTAADHEDDSVNFMASRKGILMLTPLAYSSKFLNVAKI
ncbi:hypothetical protein AUC60_02210 [Pseudomonas caspiana]|uniref:Uncharacterized protein n=1 Tax=Pseudomonas caspiana TaxID=1451454 RepID=A0A1Y3PBJ0_9PSED|nr:hypothetical protein AUC60_02210 [Pseudomonas caspiana]